MKTNEIIRCKAFIIPSSLYCPDELDFNGGFILDSLKEYSQKTQQKWFYSHNEEWRKEHRNIPNPIVRNTSRFGSANLLVKTLIQIGSIMALMVMKNLNAGDL